MVSGGADMVILDSYEYYNVAWALLAHKAELNTGDWWGQVLNYVRDECAKRHFFELRKKGERRQLAANQGKLWLERINDEYYSTWGGGFALVAESDAGLELARW